MKIAVTSEYISSRWQRGNSQRARGMTRKIIKTIERLSRCQRLLTFERCPSTFRRVGSGVTQRLSENQMAFYAAALLSKECCRVSVRKSKTFQGALKKHIKTVHENCVSSSSKTSRLSTYRLKRNRNMFERLRLTEVESKIILLYLYNILVFE
jgi:hypothetical protein